MSTLVLFLFMCLPNGVSFVFSSSSLVGYNLSIVPCYFLFLADTVFNGRTQFQGVTFTIVFLAISHHWTLVWFCQGLYKHYCCEHHPLTRFLERHLSLHSGLSTARVPLPSHGACVALLSMFKLFKNRVSLPPPCLPFWRGLTWLLSVPFPLDLGNNQWELQSSVNAQLQEDTREEETCAHVHLQGAKTCLELCVLSELPSLWTVVSARTAFLQQMFQKNGIILRSDVRAPKLSSGALEVEA